MWIVNKWERISSLWELLWGLAVAMNTKVSGKLRIATCNTHLQLWRRLLIPQTAISPIYPCQAPGQRDEPNSWGSIRSGSYQCSPMRQIVTLPVSLWIEHHILWPLSEEYIYAQKCLGLKRVYILEYILCQSYCISLCCNLNQHNHYLMNEFTIKYFR